MKCNDKLHQTEIELSDCKEQLTVWEERCLNAETNATNYEKELKQLTHQSEEEGLLAMRRLKVAEDRVKELHLLLLQKTQDLENAQEIARKLRREYQSTRQDAEGMLQVISLLSSSLFFTSFIITIIIIINLFWLKKGDEWFRKATCRVFKS